MEAKWLLVILLFGLTSAIATAQTTKRESRAQKLYNQYKNKKALKIYNDILAKNPDDLTALWHSSLLYSRIGEKFQKVTQKKQYYLIAEKRSAKALNIDQSNSQANFARAVALGEMARVGNLEDKLKAASDIKKYAVRALKADSSNAGAWFVLGSWNYKIATMNTTKEAFANILTHIPKGASTKKAITYMRKAIDLHSSYILYYYGLAQVYKATNQKDQAIHTCRTALKKPKKTPGDAKYKRKCRKIIHNLGS